MARHLENSTVIPNVKVFGAGQEEEGEAGKRRLERKNVQETG